jgi:uncharacterized protein YunC (DUF1805 family)
MSFIGCGDVRVEAQGELADVAGALVGVQDGVELLRVWSWEASTMLAVLEGELDVPRIRCPVVEGLGVL